MGQREMTLTLWSCDRLGCSARAQSYDPTETPQGWLSIVGAYQDSHGGGPARLDLCSKHATAFYNSYQLHRDVDEELNDDAS